VLFVLLFDLLLPFKLHTAWFLVPSLLISTKPGIHW